MAIFVSTDSEHVESSALKIVLPKPAGPAGIAGNPAGNPDGTTEPASSMASLVTRLSQIAPVEQFKSLSCGIDSLYLGLSVLWQSVWSKILLTFEDMKMAAQGTSGIPCITDIGREYLFLSNGKPPQYRYHLQFLEYNLYIAKTEKYGHTPNVYVCIRSSTLWHFDLEAIIDLLECDLSNFGGVIENIRPSRVDLCADFRLNAPPTKTFIDEHRVSRSQATDTRECFGLLETFYCGSNKSEVQVTIYNKELEISKSNKQWFLPIWGTDDPTGIYRVEYRLMRSFLKNCRINNLDELQEKLGSMWGYLTTEWFSLRLPDNPESDRRTVHPWWQAVKECGEKRFGKDLGERRIFESSTVEPISKILPRVFGSLISISALSGITDREKSIEHLKKLLTQYSDDITFKKKLDIKLIKQGYRGKLGGSDHDDLRF
jgi:hypothetical protein